MEKKTKMWVWVVLIMIGVAFVFEVFRDKPPGYLKQPQQTEQKSFDKKDNCTMAFIISQEYVKRKLDAPRTADFPTYDYKCRKESGETYFVQSTVKFKNLYNVALEKTYQVKLQFTGGDDADNNNWKLISIAFL
jgi:hypothetical protein